MLLWRESSPDWGLVTLIAGDDFRAVMVSGHSEALCVATLKSVREAAGLLSPAFLKEKKKKKVRAPWVLSCVEVTPTTW